MEVEESPRRPTSALRPRVAVPDDDAVVTVPIKGFSPSLKNAGSAICGPPSTLTLPLSSHAVVGMTVDTATAFSPVRSMDGASWGQQKAFRENGDLKSSHYDGARPQRVRLGALTRPQVVRAIKVQEQHAAMKRFQMPLSTLSPSRHLLRKV